MDIVIIIFLPVWFDVGAAEHFNFIIPVLKVLHSTATQQRKSFGFSCTGSFRKNGKSKTVFIGIKFHEKLIFSAFFSLELATNLRSLATRSVTITLWHPEKVAPPVWFQALVG